VGSGHRLADLPARELRHEITAANIARTVAAVEDLETFAAIEALGATA
jgi:hypothetical protein